MVVGFRVLLVSEVQGFCFGFLWLPQECRELGVFESRLWSVAFWFESLGGRVSREPASRL